MRLSMLLLTLWASQHRQHIPVELTVSVHFFTLVDMHVKLDNCYFDSPVLSLEFSFVVHYHGVQRWRL
jgi:hypothetical protein